MTTTSFLPRLFHVTDKMLKRDDLTVGDVKMVVNKISGEKELKKVYSITNIKMLNK